MTISSYQFNHPKNYLGYAVARSTVDTKTAADGLTEDYVVGTPGQARRGAQHLGLIDAETYELTTHGKWVVDELPDWLEVDDAFDVLREFHELRGARKRFCEAYPALEKWGPTIASADPTIARLMDILHRQGSRRVISLNALVSLVASKDVQFAIELFLRDDDTVRDEVVDERESATVIDMYALESGTIEVDGSDQHIYRSPTTYQLHNLLWHLGVLEEKGTQSHELTPYEEYWSFVDTGTLDAADSVASITGD